MTGASVPSTALDLTTSPGDVILSNAPTIDQQNTAGTTTGTGFGTPAWTGQTFIAGVTGQLVKTDIQLFCSGCGATPPNLTLSVRATSAGLPTGADLASVTLPGTSFASGAITTFAASFGSPATLTSPESVSACPCTPFPGLPRGPASHTEWIGPERRT